MGCKCSPSLSRETMTDSMAHRFRWVFCQLEALRRTLPAHIRHTLDDMPKTLDETYKRALLELDEDMRQDAQRLFQCLSASIRPLRVEELADILAIRFNEEIPQFNPDWRLGDAEEAVLSVCSNLVSVVDVHGSQVVQFSHFSVKEFLTSDRLATSREDLSGYNIAPHSAHTILAQASLGVLLQLDDSIDKDSVQKFPLSGYAAEHWVDHSRFENVSLSVRVAMEQLFNPEKPHFSAWVWIYDIDDPWRGSMPTIHPERPEAAPLYYAVLCGFRGLIEHLIATYPGDIDARGGYYENPLSAALIKEDMETALSLLQRGADVNARDKGGMGPLHRASQRGHAKIVQMLLDHNADINLPDLDHLETITDVGSPVIKGWTPLHLASEEGHVKISELLIQHGADVCSPRNDGWTPLHSASASGHVKIAELLIQHGADVCSPMNDGWGPLHSASQEGHVKMAELLIQHGADVQSSKNDGWTPLHSASDCGHVKMAELLIQHGADVCSPMNDGWTPLHSASQVGHVMMVELLIQCGAHVSPHDSNNRTPLHLAVLKGNLNIVKLLFESGADPNIYDSNGQTPLDMTSDNAVASFLSQSITPPLLPPVEVLNQHQNDVPLPDLAPMLESPREDVKSSHHIQTSVNNASKNGQIDIVHFLLDCGSDIDERDNYRQTALAVASRNGKLKVAELLIERGANVNSRDMGGYTPLHSAIEGGNFDIVQLLLNHNADLNAISRNGSTPLD